MEQQTHVLERTSPKGQRFIGRCTLCGATGLSMSQANEVCNNPQHTSSDDALLQAITERRHEDTKPVTIDARLPVELTDPIRHGLDHCLRMLPSGNPARYEVVALLKLMDEHTASVVEKIVEKIQEVGQLPPGAHPDEAKPRDGTWLKERANWEKEVSTLRAHVLRIEGELAAIRDVSEDTHKAALKFTPEKMTHFAALERLLVAVRNAMQEASEDATHDGEPGFFLTRRDGEAINSVLDVIEMIPQGAGFKAAAGKVERA